MLALPLTSCNKEKTAGAAGDSETTSAAAGPKADLEHDDELAKKFDSVIAKASEFYKANNYEDAMLELIKLNPETFRKKSRGSYYHMQISDLKRLIDAKTGR